MKIVLTGATGFVGAEVLTHLVAHPEVTGVTCLVRRPFPSPAETVRTVVVDDFTRYDDDLVASLADHRACVWTLGGKDSDTADPERYERITHTVTLAFAAAMAEATDAFTFCYLSGALADPTETARLPWQRLTRHLKGRTEKDLQALTADHPGFRAHCFRPGGVLPRSTGRVARALLGPIALRVDELATGLVDVAVRPDAPPVLSHAAIRRRARPHLRAPGFLD